MKRMVKLYIGDILENIILMKEIIGVMEYETFIANTEKKYAVVRCIEIIGEAVKHVPEDVRRKYPDIPWREMAGMRDKVIHFYMGVDYGIVWQVATVDLRFRLLRRQKRVLRLLESLCLKTCAKRLTGLNLPLNLSASHTKTNAKTACRNIIPVLFSKSLPAAVKRCLLWRRYGSIRTFSSRSARGLLSG